MADIEKEVEDLILAGLDEQEQPEIDEEPPTAEQAQRKVIDVDLYRLEGGAVLLVPGGSTNPFSAQTVDSISTTSDTDAAGEQEIPLEEEAADPALAGVDDTDSVNATGTVVAPPTTGRRKVKRSALLALLLTLLLLLGAASYIFVLPLTASATVTLTPVTRAVQAQTTLIIVAHPQANQVQGRMLAAYSLTASKQVPATGHAHQDATRAVGVMTFYNADISPHTIPAGASFTAPNGAIVVTDATVTIQAAYPPAFGTAIAPAHVAQFGNWGNISSHAIYTRCCGSEFVTATNITPFYGGQDARDYSFIQNSDIQHATAILLASLTPQVTAQLQHEVSAGESLVNPFCTPQTVSSAESGAQVASVTVSVTQTCRSAAYTQDSLQQTATTLLAQTRNMGSYQQVGPVQVTINGSSYTNSSARLNVTLSGTWVYHFSSQELAHMTQLIAGETSENAKLLLERVNGIQRVNIQVTRFDFKDLLPNDPGRIHVGLLVVAME